MSAIIVVAIVIGSLFLGSAVLASARRRSQRRMQDAIIEEMTAICGEYERGFLQQLAQINDMMSSNFEATIESRYRARLIGAIYSMQGYLDLGKRRGKPFFPLTYGEQMAMSSGVAAESLKIHGSVVEPDCRKAAGDLIASITVAIVNQSLDSLASGWCDIFVHLGYQFDQNTIVNGFDVSKSVDGLILGWARQSATSGMKLYSEIAYS